MKKGKASALLPIGVFLLLFIGAGILTGDFGAVPPAAAFLIALLVGLLQNKKIPFAQKLSVAAQSAGEENVMVMCLIFLLAGAFSGSVNAAGGAESAVNLGLSLLPPRFAVAGVFVIACFVSLSMGTSMGTIAALAPIAAGISERTGILMPICIAAVVCGAMFGDNLSMISDTTIAATRTQGCAMRDKFKENFFLVLPAAILTLILFLALTWNVQAPAQTEHYPFYFWRVIPYLVVLIGALCGVNVFFVLISGTVLALIIGVADGAIPLENVFSVMGQGMEGMFEITVVSLLVAAIVGLVRQNGGVDFLIFLIRRRIHSQRGAELGISALTAATDLSSANNTVAIVIAGPIVKEIAAEYQIAPKRAASLMDIFASVCQGLIPYGAQLLSAAKLSALTPFAIIPYLFYPVLMGLSTLLSLLFRKRPT